MELGKADKIAHDAVEGAKGAARSAKVAAEGARDKHGDKVADGLEKVGAFVDEKTGHRFSDKIDKGLGAVTDPLRNSSEEPGPAADTSDDTASGSDST
ncbi:MAG: hypothetical protein GEU93_10025 [Propionibacteriales bacterium]|nr:hypothetical protein [Propionibacteriales bacterium]